MKEKLTLLISLLVLVGVIWGFFTWTDRFALCEDVRSIQRSVDYKFKSMEIRETNTRIWQLEDRCNKKPPDETACKELKRLQEEKKIYELELKELGRKK